MLTWVLTPLMAVRAGPKMATRGHEPAVARMLVLVRVRRSSGQEARELGLDTLNGAEGAVIIDKQSMPNFQREHEPDALLAVDTTIHMVVDHLAHHSWAMVGPLRGIDRREVRS